MKKQKANVSRTCLPVGRDYRGLNSQITADQFSCPNSYRDLRLSALYSICGNQREMHLYLIRKTYPLIFRKILSSSELENMHENEISYIVRSCIFKVFNSLGPGLLESAYVAALVYEIEAAGLTARTQVPLPMVYKSVTAEVGYRMDVVVEQKVIIEVKSVEVLAEVHHKQLITYLRLSGLKLGLLVNFNTTNIADSIFRKVNGL